MGCFGSSLDCCTWAIGARHCWLKTRSKEAGLGPAGGGAPEAETSPCYCVQTRINSHDGQWQGQGVQCVDLVGCDEDCVNKELDVGKDKGTFGPCNNCNTLVEDILRKCGCGRRCVKWSNPEWIRVKVGPGEWRTKYVESRCVEWSDPHLDSYPVPRL